MRRDGRTLALRIPHDSAGVVIAVLEKDESDVIISSINSQGRLARSTTSSSPPERECDERVLRVGLTIVVG